MSRGKWGVAVVAALMMAGFAAGGSAVAGAERPRLSVQTVEGGRFELADHRGSWVVVNFWATWCSPCLKEMPELDALDRRRDDVAVIGLAYEEIAREDLLAFLEKHPVDYPLAVVDVFAPPEDFASPRGLPTTYLIAPDGTVLRQFLGPVTATTLEEAIASAEQQQP